MTYTKKLSYILQVLLISIFSILVIQGSADNVDTTFNASAVRTNGSNPESLSIKTSLIQPDGKILIGGSFTVVGGYSRCGIARLNADGSLDTTFNPPEIYKSTFLQTNRVLAATIYGIGLQPDGKILVSGDFLKVNGESRPGLIRLNSDGSPDEAFNNTVIQNLPGSVGIIYDIKVLPNGKILLAGARIVRLNSDGSYDNSFNSTLGMTLKKVKLLPDGRIMVCGTGNMSFNNVGLARLNEDGSIDFSFSGVGVRTGPNPFELGTVNDFEVLANGQILIVGNFTVVNGFNNGRIARINSDGSIDLTFNTNNPGANQVIESVKVMNDGKILIGGVFTTYNTVQTPKIARLNTDGTPDLTFSYAGNDGTVNGLQLLPNNKILVVGEGGNWDRLSIINFDGSPGNPVSSLIGKSGLVNDVLIQSDGKILVAGRFESANGVPRKNIARYNSDGTIDNNFTPDIGTNILHLINRVAVQPDGKILIGTWNAGFRRLNSDGSFDQSFNLVVGGQSQQVLDIAVLPNGQIICVGTFSISGNSTTIAIFNSNGTVNSSSPVTTNGLIRRILLLPDGKMLIAGEFTQVSGANRGRIARLNSDGTHDTTFNPPGGANLPIYDMAVQPDGKIVVVGDFDALNGSNTHKYVGRLNSDGTLDTSFNQIANSPIYTVEVESSGKILIGGTMKTVGGVSRSGIARLNSDGSVDNTFRVGNGTNDYVWDLTLQSDGKILAGGEFSTFNGKSTIGIVRLLNISVPPNILFDYDGDQKADISVFRPAENKWYILQSSNNSMLQVTFAVAGDVPAPSDYDGDGKTDIAVFRPSNGDWWYLSSISGAQVNVHWGAAGDIPRPSDFDGDGKADFVVYRPTNSVWYRFSATGQTSILAFGIAEDKPLVGDFDGDGKSDPAVFRPSTGDWWYASSASGGQFAVVHWGANGDIPVPGDYDADGKTDFVVYRPSNGGWYILRSGEQNYTILQFGLADDKPVAVDYDGDGKADVAVWRPLTGTWYLLQTTAGFGAVQWGVATDIPTENTFLP